MMRVKPATGKIGLGAMAEMTTSSEIEAQHSISGIDYGKENSLVGLCSGMRLHIGIVCSKQFPGSIDRSLLDHIDEFAATVEAISRVTLQSLVSHLVTQGVEHRLTHDIFRGDQL